MVGREPIMVALPASHPLATRKAVHAAALAGEAFILPHIAPGVSFHEHTMAVGRRGGFDPIIAHRGRDFVSIANMVSVGIGVAVVPASLRCLHLPNLVFMPLADVREQADLSAAFRRDEQAPAVITFIEQLRALCASTTKELASTHLPFDARRLSEHRAGTRRAPKASRKR
jgi:DNA-binding transcriptional LysR family regulator